MKFHIHRDPNWQVRGCWRYYECKCGARRVARAYAKIIGPIEPGWPAPVDSHGRRVDVGPWTK